MAVVAGITTFAYTLPAPTAFAEGKSVPINVTVKGDNTAVKIISPSDQTTSSVQRVTFRIRHLFVRKAKYTLTGPDNKKVALDRDTFNTASDDIVDEVHADLPLGKYGGYIFTVVSENGPKKAEDMIQYNYKDTTVTPAPTPGETPTPTPDPKPTDPVKPSEPDTDNGDPKFKIEYDVKVCMIKFQAYELSGGKELFKPEQEFKIPEPAPKDRVAIVTLKFASFGAKTGKYRIVATSYTKDAGGKCVIKTDNPNIINNFDYNNPKITTPNTGHKLLGLDLGQFDYMIAAITAFLSVAAFSLYFLIRKKRA